MKAMPWFRFYHEAIDDEKLRLLAFEDRWHFCALLCLKARGLIDDESPTKRRKICVKMGLDTMELDKVAFRLAEVGLIDAATLQPLAWDERQFLSDNSSERVKKYREKLKSQGRTTTGYLKFKEAVFSRDGSACVYCGSQEHICLDHITPVSQNGGDVMENLATACKACNSGKAGRTPDQAGMRFLNQNLEAKWRAYAVTVTVTAQDTDTDTDSDKEGNKYPAAFEAVWQEYPRRPGANKAGTFKAFTARIKANAKLEDMIEGMRRYAAYLEAMGTEPQYIKQPETFFGPAEHYLSDWTPPRSTPRGNRQDQRSAVMAGLEETGEKDARRPSDIDV